MRNLEVMFHQEMLDLHGKWKKECNYNASIFIQIVEQRGGLQAAKYLLQGQGLSRGFINLMNMGRLDLTLENLVLETTWNPLFSETELGVARNRLKEAGFFKKSAEGKKGRVPLCPRCNQRMVLRTSRQGDKFYGCSQFPDCKGSRDYEG